jgi:hypothetical protein
VTGAARLCRRGFRLEYASMAWMAAEAAVAITAGILASSIALTGFGLDSVIEFFSAAIVIWEQGRVAGTVQPAGNIAASMIANAGSIGGPEFSCIYRRIRIIVLLNMWHCDEAEPNNSFISMPASPFSSSLQASFMLSSAQAQATSDLVTARCSPERCP